MDDGVQPLFPVPSCVVFGRRRATAKAMPDKVRAYAGSLPLRDAHEEMADKRLRMTEGAASPTAATFIGGSAYRKAFRQGATLVPRMLCLVERRQVGRLGADISAPSVQSRRSTQEKMPWKELPGIENTVEAQFLHPVLLGESILPFRIFRSFEGLVPVTDDGRVLDAKAAMDSGYDHLAGWMRKAEMVWDAHAESGQMKLAERWNFHGGLQSQFPLAPLRIIYAASGTIPAAVILRNSSAAIEHGIYWFAPGSINEGRYLLAILNSETARARGESMQARGQWGARHFDKVIFNLPIPRFDSKSYLHRELATLSAKAEKVATAVALPEKVKFQGARRLVRTALKDDGVAGDIDTAVARLLDGG